MSSSPEPSRRGPLAAVLSLATAGALLGSLLAGPAEAFQDTRPDRVFVRNSRGNIQQRTGIVTVNGLLEVVVIQNERDRKFDSSEVVRIIFGDVPAAYDEGVDYLARGDYENAAAKFRAAASEDTVRAVIRAAARLRASEALMKGGATDPRLFGEARSELERLVSDYPDSRDLPQARSLLARSIHMSGEPGPAAAAYQSLFGELVDGVPNPGYDLDTCAAAGLRAAQAYLEAGEVEAAKSAYKALESALALTLGQSTEDDAARLHLEDLQTQARLGAGFCMIVDGQASQAATFFDREVTASEDRGPGARFCARLGLAEALLAQGEHRRAQIEFAQVSALDFTDRDRVARALVGLARCATSLSDTNAVESARTWLKAAAADYGDTPSARQAREILESL